MTISCLKPPNSFTLHNWANSCLLGIFLPPHPFEPASWIHSLLFHLTRRYSFLTLTLAIIASKKPPETPHPKAVYTPNLTLSGNLAFCADFIICLLKNNILEQRRSLALLKGTQMITVLNHIVRSQRGQPIGVGFGERQTWVKIHRSNLTVCPWVSQFTSLNFWFPFIYKMGKWITCSAKHPGVRKIPWRRKWQPTPVFLPG